MVAYDFKCKKCGKQFEITCHMDERKDKAVCPKCGSSLSLSTVKIETKGRKTWLTAQK